MRSVRGCARACAAMLVVAHALEAAADPSVPQINPIHAQREDAQRLAQQRRQVVLPAAVPTAQQPPVAASERDATSPAASSLRPLGVTLLIIGGAAGIVGLGSLETETTTAPVLLLSSAAIGAIVGVSLILRHPRTPVRVSPAVSGGAAGVSITARF